MADQTWTDEERINLIREATKAGATPEQINAVLDAEDERHRRAGAPGRPVTPNTMRPRATVPWGGLVKDVAYGAGKMTAATIGAAPGVAVTPANPAIGIPMAAIGAGAGQSLAELARQSIEGEQPNYKRALVEGAGTTATTGALEGGAYLGARLGSVSPEAFAAASANPRGVLTPVSSEERMSLVDKFRALLDQVRFNKTESKVKLDKIVADATAQGKMMDGQVLLDKLRGQVTGAANQSSQTSDASLAAFADRLETQMKAQTRGRTFTLPGKYPMTADEFDKALATLTEDAQPFLQQAGGSNYVASVAKARNEAAQEFYQVLGNNAKLYAADVNARLNTKEEMDRLLRPGTEEKPNPAFPTRANRIVPDEVRGMDAMRVIRDFDYQNKSTLADDLTNLGIRNQWTPATQGAAASEVAALVAAGYRNRSFLLDSAVYVAKKALQAGAVGRPYAGSVAGTVGGVMMERSRKAQQALKEKQPQ